MNAPIATPPLVHPNEERQRIRLEKVALHRLQGADDIATVKPLREAIDLSVHVAAGAGFYALEKKETTAASWSHSTLKTNGSARSASCRWATD